MKITCDHPQSSYGIPVILDDAGEPMVYRDGLTAVLERIGWSRETAAVEAGYKSGRSIERFWQGHPPSAQLLNRLGVELEKQKAKS